jgi:hypothetical protein
MRCLSGCGTASSSTAVCPPVKEYSPHLQRQLADEVDALPPASIIPGFLSDYAVLRRQVRACREA